jgi:hypothetical protein
MKNCLAILFAVLLLGCRSLNPGNPSGITGEVWVHLDSAWREPPAGAEVIEQTAWATLVTAEPDGRFAWIKCLLIRQGKEVRVSQGDPQTVYLGRWYTKNSTIHADYRLTYQTVELAGQVYPGNLERSFFSLQKSTLLFNSQRFAPISGLDQESLKKALDVARETHDGGS